MGKALPATLVVIIVAVGLVWGLVSLYRSIRDRRRVRARERVEWLENSALWEPHATPVPVSEDEWCFSVRRVVRDDRTKSERVIEEQEVPAGQRVKDRNFGFWMNKTQAMAMRLNIGEGRTEIS